MTDEGCRAEIRDERNVSGLYQTELHATPHPSKIGSEEPIFATFPPGEGFGVLRTRKKAPRISPWRFPYTN